MVERVATPNDDDNDDDVNNNNNNRIILLLMYWHNSYEVNYTDSAET